MPQSNDAPAACAAPGCAGRIGSAAEPWLGPCKRRWWRMVASSMVDACITLADAGCRPSGFCNAARCHFGIFSSSVLHFPAPSSNRANRHDRRRLRRIRHTQRTRPEHARRQGPLLDERAASWPARPHLRPAARGGAGRVGAAPGRPCAPATAPSTTASSSWWRRSPPRCGTRPAPTARSPRSWPRSRPGHRAGRTAATCRSPGTRCP
jgi:hypothetical protein